MIKIDVENKKIFELTEKELVKLVEKCLGLDVPEGFKLDDILFEHTVYDIARYDRYSKAKKLKICFTKKGKLSK